MASDPIASSATFLADTRQLQSFVFHGERDREVEGVGVASMVHIEMTDTPNANDLENIDDKLVDFNRNLIGQSDRRAIAVIIRNEDGVAVGGLSGTTARGWLYIDNLFVPPDLRGQGIATRLLELVESEARQRGCRGAWLDTVNVDAYRLYERNGYTPFGKLENYANGHDFNFMSKAL